MRVYGFKRDEKGIVHQGIMEVGEELEDMRGFVGGGYIDMVSLTEELSIVLNDEGKLLELPYVAAWLDVDGISGDENGILDLIAGDFFVCRHNEEGVTVDIEDQDIIEIERQLMAINMCKTPVISI